jgi:hypothetical protein
MTMIDRDELLKKIAPMGLSNGSVLGHHSGTADVIAEMIQNAPTIDPKTLRPVAHWEEIPGSYEVCAGKSGSWCVAATRCSNPDCGEANPCGLKTPFCPMCGFRMEDVPYDDD